MSIAATTTPPETVFAANTTFRPFPFEASNIQNLIQSVECFALLVKTDPTADPRHHGMSLFLADKGPGFSVSRKLVKLVIVMAAYFLLCGAIMIGLYEVEWQRAH